jgi:hypothetical protein
LFIALKLHYRKTREGKSSGASGRKGKRVKLTSSKISDEVSFAEVLGYDVEGVRAGRWSDILIESF